MKKIIILSFILINCIACSNGQSKSNNTKKLSKEILGCWALVDIYYDVKSNYPQIDSMFLVKKQNLNDEIKETSFITKFFENTMNEYDEHGIPDNNPSSYKIQGDSIFSRGIFRQDKFSGKISMVNDTILCIEENASNELKRIFYDLKRRDKIVLPENIKVEKIKRYTMLVRVSDCDKYKEEEE